MNVEHISQMLAQVTALLQPLIMIYIYILYFDFYLWFIMILISDHLDQITSEELKNHTSQFQKRNTFLITLEKKFVNQQNNGTKIKFVFEKS